MTEEVFTLRRKELDRLEVIRRVVSKRLRRKEAACQLAAWHSPDQASGASLPGARPPGSRERPAGGISSPGCRPKPLRIAWRLARQPHGLYRGLGNRTPGQTLARHLSRLSPGCRPKPLRIAWRLARRPHGLYRGLGNRTPGQMLARHLPRPTPPLGGISPPTWRTHTTTIISRERPAGGISPPMWWTHTKTGFV